MLEPDTLLGTYRLIGRLGAGGMGEVWKAEDTRLGRTVAIKILPPGIASDPNAIARMKREARTAAQLYHPNIATIHAFEEANDRLFIVMEFVDGEPLSALIRRGRIPEGDVCRIGRSIADALAEAHDKGIVHRDIKPDNVIVNGPRVKVLDFGIAKQVGNEAVGANDPTSVLTQQGMIIGTVTYMSPEQALGKSLDGRTDLFSLGVVLYEAATGGVPFRGETATETIMHIVRDEAPMPASISRGLASIIHRCLSKNREERYPTARELAEALERQLAQAPTAPLSAKRIASPAAPTVMATQVRPQPPSKKWPWVTGVVLLVLVGALAAFIATRTRKAETKAATTTTIAPPPAPASAPPAASLSVTAPATIVEEPTTTTAALAPPPPVTTTTAAPPPVVPPPPARTADDDYNAGVTKLLEREPRLARELFESAIAKDPHHAKAHFRLGELTLFMRDGYTARREFNAALANGDRLEPRERKLSELGLALLDRDRVLAEQLFREIAAMSPRDPDLMRFREFIGGDEQQRPPQRPPFRRQRPRP